MTEERQPKAKRWRQAHQLLRDFDRLLAQGETRLPAPGEAIRTGVDLGTSSILTVVLGADLRPLAGLMETANVVRDGVVMDFVNARRIVARQKETLEERLGRALDHAAAAIPPGVSQGNVRAVRHVLEGAGYHCTDIVNESNAAAMVLGVENGAMVDVGGGTTGISIFKEGRALYAADEPTGGHHMTLVLSGSLGLPYDQAELEKRDTGRHHTVFPIIRPVVEKMAAITGKYIAGYEVAEVYVAGGASAFEDFSKSFSDALGLPVYRPLCPWLVTPLGIAMHDLPAGPRQSVEGEK